MKNDSLLSKAKTWCRTLLVPYLIDFVELANKAKWTPLLYLSLAIADTATIGQSYNYYIHYTGIFVGMIAVVYVVSELLRTGRVTTSKFLTNASFFVFAIHGLFISRFTQLLIMTFHPELPVAILFLYFFVPVATILISLGLYKYLNKGLPSFTKAATGGR